MSMKLATFEMKMTIISEAPSEAMHAIVEAAEEKAKEVGVLVRHGYGIPRSGRGVPVKQIDGVWVKE